MIKINYDEDKLKERIKDIPDSVKKELQEYFQMNTKELENSIDDNLLPSLIFGEFTEFSTVRFLKDQLANMPDDLIVLT